MSLDQEITNILEKKKRDESEEILSKVIRLKNEDSEIDLFGEMEERVTRTVPLDKLERLYRIDWLTWRQVNKYIEKIVGPGLILEGNERIVKILNEWIDKVGFKFILEENVRDIFLAGNAWSELGYTPNGTDIIKVLIVNPKTIDYIRDKLTKYVEVDKKTGDFLGFKREKIYRFAEVEYRKDRIKVAGKVVWTPNKEDEDGRDRIVHLKLWGYGESYIGLTPLEPCYLNAIIRLNISKNTGEGAFRSGGIIAYVGTEDRPASNKQIDQLGEDLKSVETETIFVFKHNVRIERFPSPEIGGREALLYYYVNTQCGGIGIPFGMIMEPGSRGYRGDMELKLMDFETSIKSIQERLAYQIREQYFKRVLKARGINPDKCPKVVFRTYMPSVERERYRNISSLARRGLINYDPRIAKRLLKELDLPTDYIDKEIEEWDKRKNPFKVKTPKRSRDIDMGKIEDLVDEKIEERLSEREE